MPIVQSVYNVTKSLQNSMSRSHTEVSRQLRYCVMFEWTVHDLHSCQLVDFDFTRKKGKTSL